MGGVEHKDIATHGEHKHEPVYNMDGNSLAATYDPSQTKRWPEACQQRITRQDGYTRWIGQKFEANGDVKHYPGNTIICHLPSESVLYRVLLIVSHELANQDFAPFYGLLPPASWHMTVFEGVCDQVREPGFWPEDMSPNAPLASCNALFEEKLASFDLGTELPFRMAIEGWETLKDGIAVRVVSASVAEESRIRQLRDRLSKLLGIRHPTHETYVFHISVAYLLRHLSQEQSQDVWAFLQKYRPDLPTVFELGAPEFCLFDDVTAFYRQLFLERHESHKDR